MLIKKINLKNTVVVTVIITLIVYGRLVTSLLYPGNLNPDEMQMGANALRIINYGINLNSFDGTSSGLLNSLLLSWPFIFNLDITYLSVRLTALILVILISIFTFKILKISTNHDVATIFIIPLILFYSFTKDPDFLHYSSELLTVMLLIASLYLFIHQIQKQAKHGECSPKVTFLILLLLGSVPYAKMQFIIPALTLAFLCFIFIHVFKLYRGHFLSFLAGGFFTSIILLTPLYYQNNFEDFYISYFLWSAKIVQTSAALNEFKEIVTLNTNLAIERGQVLAKPGSETRSTLSYYLKYNSGLHLIYFYSIFSLCSFFFILLKKKIIKEYTLIVLLIFLISIFISIMTPGLLHRHYLHAFFPFIAIFAGTSTGIYFLEIKKNLKKISFYCFIFVYIFGLIFLSHSLFNESKNIYAKTKPDKNILLGSASFKSPELFKYLKIDQISNLYIWGWMPQWYTLSNLTPATRETIAQNQILDSKLQNYYRKRAMNDIFISRPNLVVDAVIGGSFGFNDPNKNISSFPELQNYIINNYKLINGYKDNSQCAKKYISIKKYDLLKKYLIDISSIKSKLYYNQDLTASNLDDFSVTEDICLDYWLLPDKQIGEVSLKFKKKELVKKILILNTNNSKFIDRATDEIAINLFYQNKLKKRKIIKLKLYPFWTEYVLDKPVLVDEMQINILSYYGKGAGLNEIKVYRNF